MVEELGDSYDELAHSHSHWLLITGVILLASSLVSVLWGSTIQTSLIEDLFPTLITSVATVLAISFSVLFISTQIASERYSPAFTVTFVNDPIVKSGFGLGVFCIISNLFVFSLSSRLYAILSIEPETISSILFWGIGGLLVGVNISFFILLYPFIRLVLIQTIPENLLAQFNRRYDAEQYADEAKKADRVSDHPMQPIYDFSRNSIHRQDYSAAIAGIDALFELPASLVKDLKDRKQGSTEELYDPILSHYSESLVDQSDDVGFSDAVSSVCDGLVTLGNAASNADDRETFHEIFSCPYLLLNEHDRFNQDTNQTVVNCCGELFQSATNNLDLLRELVPRISRLVGDLRSTNSRTSLRTCLENIADTHDAILGQGDEAEMNLHKEEVLLGQEEQKPPWETSDDTSLPITLKCTYLMMQTTSGILATEDQEPPGIVYKKWESVVQQSHEANLEAHVQHVLRRYIELVVYTEITYNTGISASNRVSGLIQDDNLKDVVITTCESILDDDRTISEISEFRFLESSLPDIWSPIPIAEVSDDFLEEVEKIKENVDYTSK